MRNKSLNRTRERITKQHAKDLYDLMVEYIYYRSKAKDNQQKEDLLDRYNDMWLAKCYSNRKNKYVDMNYLGFKNLATSIKSIHSFQKSLGLPIEKFNLLQKLFGI